MKFNLKDIEKSVAAGLEHGIDTWLDSVWAHNPPDKIEAEVNHYLETSPLVKLLGGLAVPIAEGEIDSIIEHNDSATALAKIKAYIHGRFLIK